MRFPSSRRRSRASRGGSVTSEGNLRLLQRARLRRQMPGLRLVLLDAPQDHGLAAQWPRSLRASVQPDRQCRAALRDRRAIWRPIAAAGSPVACATRSPRSAPVLLQVSGPTGDEAGSLDHGVEPVDRAARFRPAGRHWTPARFASAPACAFVASIALSRSRRSDPEQAGKMPHLIRPSARCWRAVDLRDCRKSAAPAQQISPRARSSQT